MSNASEQAGIEVGGVSTVIAVLISLKSLPAYRALGVCDPVQSLPLHTIDFVRSLFEAGRAAVFRKRWLGSCKRALTDEMMTGQSRREVLACAPETDLLVALS